MEFMKKLKKRLIIAVVQIIIGAAFVALFCCNISQNQYLQTLGIALIITGIARIVQYKRITKDEESIRRQRIAETDERNIAIMHKAKSTAFGLYVLIAALTVIVLEVIEKTDYSNILALNVCTLVALYWISYLVYSKRS